MGGADLADYEARYQALFASLDAVYVHDLNGRFLDANAAALELTGYSRDEFLALDIPDLIHPEDLPRVRQGISQLETFGRVTVQPEARIRRKNGDYVYVEANASVVFREGRPFALLGIARDITKLKEAEQAVATQNEALLKLTLCSNDLSLADSQRDVQRLIVEQLRDLTDCVIVTFSEYDPATQTASVKHAAMRPAFIERVNRLSGGDIIGISGRFSDEASRRLLAEPVMMAKTLEEAAFGSVSAEDAAAIQRLLKVDRFISLAYSAEGSLYGNSLLALEEGQPDPPEGILRGFCSIAALALRRAKAESELRASETKYRTVVDTIHEGVLVTSTKGVLYFNQRVTEMLGYSREEMQQLEFGATIHPDDRAGALGSLPEMLQHGTPVHLEMRLVTKTGNIITTSAHGSAIDWQGDQAIIVFLEDISEQKRAQADEALRREILQILNEPGEILDSVARVVDTIKARIGFGAVGIRLREGDDYPYVADDGFSYERPATESGLLGHETRGGLCRDGTGTVRSSCACARVIAGSTAQSSPFFTKGGSFWTNDAMEALDLLPAEDPGSLPRNVCIRGGHSTVAIVPIKDKETIVGLLHLGDRRVGRLNPDAVGRLEGLAAHIGAALLRRNAEAELERREEQYQTLVSLSPDAILVDDDGKFIYANAAAARVFGADSPEQLVGADVYERTHPDFRELVAWGANATVPGSVLPPREIKILRLDGTEVEVEATAARIEYDGRWVNQVVWRDISARKESEARQREFERQLQERQKLESLGVLAGGIAHDFNNMLTAIIGYSDLVLASRLKNPAESLDDVREIREAAERAKDLTGAILAFSRRQPRELQLLALDGLVADLQPLLRHAIGEDIELVFDLPDERLMVEADRSQLTQVVMNLVVNARDAMPSGGTLTIAVALRVLDEVGAAVSPVLTPGEWLVLTVSDTGVGMEEEVRIRVFEPFFTTKKPGEGTGLGLSTAYGIARQSGGDIVVTSEPNGGSTFDVYLPPPAGAVETESTAERRLLRSMAESTTPAGGSTILLVEDEPAVRRLALRLLEEQGFKVLVASDGREALERGSSVAKIDLLLTDLVLPGGLQGDEVARSIMVTRPDTKVLFMSGYPRNVMLESGRLADGINFLDKPFTNEGFIAKIREVLGGDA